MAAEAVSHKKLGNDRRSNLLQKNKSIWLSLIFLHWCPVKKLRLLHYVRNDTPLQDIEGW
jgi:hypothetical protein